MFETVNHKESDDVTNIICSFSFVIKKNNMISKRILNERNTKLPSDRLSLIGIHSLIFLRLFCRGPFGLRKSQNSP